MKNYKIVREPYYVNNGCSCCEAEDIGIWYVYCEGEIITYEDYDGNNEPVSFGFEDEALYYILEQNSINVEKEEKYD